MATLTFSYDTGSVSTSRITDAICSKFNYQPTIPDPNNVGQTISNPETKANYAKRMIKERIIAWVREQEIITATNTASDSVTPITLT